MIKYIENLLYKKTKNTQSEILYTQWSYDKKVIPEILKTISNLFPHYSLHDESHSISIINNIVRVLGKENIDNLSSIDLWLILEASYSHDIGMAISAKEIKETIDSKKFITFFKNILREEKHSLYEFASQFKIKNNKIKYKFKDLNLEFHDSIKFILAEYYRREHSARSKEIIERENSEFKMIHNEMLIPKRIFKILGVICDSHTKDFDEVMKLSFSEVGINTEDAHPRFVACMLRIGDLLDLDNNRFSDVMLRTLHKIPLETLKHKDKHLSIESFRVDRKMIEIIAKCKDYEVANITQHWFNYLNYEISNQMISWNNIVPSKEFGYLPTIGKLRVELKKYDFIDGKNKPQFKVDTEKALTLLQGAGIYSDAYQSIREILQNAVDATLIRIWLEHGDSKDFSSPSSQDFLDLLKDYPIVIDIKEKNVGKKSIVWNIEIEDCGIGISKKDLHFLMNTGSSSKNLRKREIIDSMPRWMRPSGTFGIGFQSIFMLTEQVIIESKSFFDEELYKIELNSPSSKKDGAILVEHQESTHKRKVGSKIFFVYKTKRIANRYSIGANNNFTQNIIDSFDPIADDTFNVEIGYILDKINIFSTKSYLPLILFFKNNKMIEDKNNYLQKFKHFSAKNILEISHTYLNINASYIIKDFYKGQDISKSSLASLKFIGFNINILRDDASKVLTIDRNNIRKKYLKQLYTSFWSTVSEYMLKKYETFVNEEKIIVSFFLNYYSKELKIDKNNHDEWKRYKITLNNAEQLSLDNLFNKTKELVIIEDKDITNISHNKADEYKYDKNIFTITTYGRGTNNITDFIKKMIPLYFKSVQTKPSKNKDIYFNEDKVDIITKDELMFLLKGSDHRGRKKIPCPKEYSKLRLKNDAYKPWLYMYSIFFNGIQVPSMLSPYSTNNTKIEYKIDDKVINWVYENRYNNKTTKKEIKATYEQFREDFDIDEINKPN